MKISWKRSHNRRKSLVDIFQPGCMKSAMKCIYNLVHLMKWKQHLHFWCDLQRQELPSEPPYLVFTLRKCRNIICKYSKIICTRIPVITIVSCLQVNLANTSSFKRLTSLKLPGKNKMKPFLHLFIMIKVKNVKH